MEGRAEWRGWEEVLIIIIIIIIIMSLMILYLYIVNFITVFSLMVLTY